jgi:hypothetical protein
MVGTVPTKNYFSETVLGQDSPDKITFCRYSTDQVLFCPDCTDKTVLGRYSSYKIIFSRYSTYQIPKRKKKRKRKEKNHHPCNQKCIALVSSFPKLELACIFLRTNIDTFHLKCNHIHERKEEIKVVCDR